jgi:hypothetical protein
MYQLFTTVMDDDLEAVAEISEDLSFLIDQTKLNKAFEEVDITAEKVAHSC